MFFDKDKVRLNVTLEKVTYTPGETISGTLHLEVLKPIKITAVRISLRGKEKAWVRRRRGRRSVTYFAEHIHFQQYVTCFGFSKASGRKGDAELSAGTFAYNFSFALPVNIPPSFDCPGPNAACTLAYTLKAYVDIPNGFDAENVIFLRILAPVAANQVSSCRSTPLTFRATSAQAALCFCCSCFCCHEEDSYIRTTLALCPSVVVLFGGANQPTRFPAVQAAFPPEATGEFAESNPNPITVPEDGNMTVLRLKIDNKTKKKSLTKCRVKVSQTYLVRCQGFTNTFQRVLADVTVPFPNGPLEHGATTTFDVPIQFLNDLAYFYNEKRPSQTPVASLKTPCFESVSIIEITFPEVAADGTFSAQNAIFFASAVDMSGLGVFVPQTYTQSFLLPEVQL